MLEIKTGIRKSKLSIIQAEDTVTKLQHLFPSLKFNIVHFSSPGDRDKTTPISDAPEDFFTKDLDEAVLTDQIDIAIHSAKDLPDEIDNRLDMFFLPWQEDFRDAIVKSNKLDFLSQTFRVGSSSKRRESYARQKWPQAEILPIRGNIEERIAQLDAGCFDALIVAVAALNRLGLQKRISEVIPFEELQTPDGQGTLALTFLKGNHLLNILKEYFLKSVVFAGAGIGNLNYASIATINALKTCDICLYDALLDPKLIKHLPPNAQAIYVGKRSGGDSIKQRSISEMIVHYARQGKKVVRLKGGDPGLFGRLSEETTPLEELNIPFYVIPGINSISVSTTCTGLLLTKRDVSRGYCVATLQKAGASEAVPFTPNEISSQSLVFLMTTSKIRALKKYLYSIGKNHDEFITIIFSAGTPEEITLFSTLAEIESELEKYDTEAPSIIIIGKSASKDNIFKRCGALVNRKVFLTCSETINSKAEEAVINYLGKPILMPFIETNLAADLQQCNIFKEIQHYDWIILTSPSSVSHFMEAVRLFKVDIRKIPKIFVYGKKSEEELKSFNIFADCIGKANLFESIKEKIPIPSNILRFISDIAGSSLTNDLTKAGYKVTEKILYRTSDIDYQKLPEFDDIVFASSSAVKSFIRQFGCSSLENKRICIIGEPTKITLSAFINTANVIKPPQESIKYCIEALALDSINNRLKNYKTEFSTYSA
ncbi:MAG TPA: hypothetical protein DD381_03780 [Lentisphaeria bacterium]|nr:MAG: hypothetical protein A2X47_06850 [Lentisphaerae bacterium GWF2_38_69]HBM15452.1 hypothetical protein [Lentisphaeria bacterium]